MVIDTFWYHHRDRLPDRSNPGIRNGNTGVLLSFPLFCQRDKKRTTFGGGAHGAADQQLPDSIKINGIRVSSDPKRTYQLILPGKKAACFINPYTGEITGIDDGKGFFMKIMRLHRWLLDEYKRDGSFAWGKTIVGYSTLVLAIIIISGLVIWYPRNKKALKNRLKIKTKAGWFRFLYDLHVSGGFYAALLLLSGIDWSNLVVRLVS